MKQFILLYFYPGLIIGMITLCPALLFGQLTIEKEISNCKFGVKNASGQWIIQPNYISIAKFTNGYFWLRGDTGIGLADEYGNLKIDCIYDDIQDFRLPYALFKLKRKGRTGVFYDEKFIVQMDTLRVELDRFPNMIVRTIEKGKNFSYCIDTTGQLQFPKLEGHFQGFGHFDIAKHYSSERKVFIINKKGEVLLDRLESAKICNSNEVRFTQNSKIGVLNINGDTVVPPKFFIQSSCMNCCLDTGFYYIIRNKLDQYGLMKGDGSVILEPKWDLIWNAGYSQFFLRQEKTGSFDPDSGIVIPMVYDTLFYLAYDYNKFDFHRYLFSQKNGKFGITSPTGETLLAHDFDDIIKGERRSGWFNYFKNDQKLVCAEVIEEGLNFTNLTLVAKSSSTHIYSQNDDLLAFEINEGDIKLVRSEEIGQLFMVYLEDEVMIFKEGKRFDLGNIRSAHSFQNRFIQVHT
ncbi:MAG: WG repeat-containing protein, partial [Flavobacteriales bacterium]|nr:WG repeat-containing protein [Flavobacteriales bacterium]